MFPLLSYSYRLVTGTKALQLKCKNENPDFKDENGCSYG